MPFLSDWIRTQPSQATTLISAIISAAIALITLAVSQSLSRKKDFLILLSPKLEELYVTLNELRENNVEWFYACWQAAEGDEDSRKHIESADHLDLYGHRRANRMILYIRLYFPHLSRIHQALFAYESELNNVRHAVVFRRDIDLEELSLLGGKIGHMARLMEQEIISNRSRLLRQNFFPWPYRGASQQEIDGPPPPAPGPPFGP